MHYWGGGIRHKSTWHLNSYLLYDTLQEQNNNIMHEEGLYNNDEEDSNDKDLESKEENNEEGKLDSYVDL